LFLTVNKRFDPFGSFLEEIDVDTSPALQEKYGNEVPVLFINGRKAFKYRLAAAELEQRLKRESAAD
jgi:Glutaredoxin-like domain (DUF836)